MKVAVVGSREWPYPEMVKEFISRFHKDIVVISGHARGVDRYAETFAREAGLEVISIPANWDKHGNKAGYIRNVEMVEKCDCLVAFWDLKSKGTKHSIDLILNSNKDFLVFSVSGVVVLARTSGMLDRYSGSLADTLRLG